jgi:hypothetical protein
VAGGEAGEHPPKPTAAAIITPRSPRCDTGLLLLRSASARDAGAHAARFCRAGGVLRLCAGHLRLSARGACSGPPAVRCQPLEMILIRRRPLVAGYSSFHLAQHGSRRWTSSLSQMQFPLRVGIHLGHRLLFAHPLAAESVIQTPNFEIGPVEVWIASILGDILFVIELDEEPVEA